jgi:hypothetical protein
MADTENDKLENHCFLFVFSLFSNIVISSVYVYIVHVLLLINIDCTWLNIESVLFIRPRDYQIVYSFIYTSPVQRFNAHLESIVF